MAPLHSLGQDDQSEGEYDHFGHVMPLALALAPSDVDDVINDTIAFLR